jgi:uncharacterized surface protein with fasciclin (FAS1) repeats
MSTRTILTLAVSAALAAGCQQSDDNGNRAAGNGTAAVQNGDSKIPNTNIGQTLAGSSDHSTLLSAIKAAGLEATLSGSQPYTLFAPTNAALDKLPAGTTDNLMKPEQKGQLTALLTNLIVPGVVTADDLGKAIERGKGKAELATMGGGKLTVTKNGDALVVTDAKGNKANVTRADMLQSNGVIHVVDAVPQG